MDGKLTLFLQERGNWPDMSDIADMSPALHPIAYSLVAFTIGYQVANFMKPKFATPAGGPHLRRASSSQPPKDDINLDLTDPSPGTPAKSHSSSKGKGKGKSSTNATKTSSTNGSGLGSDSDTESEIDTDSEAEDLALALSSHPESLKPTQFDEVKLVLVVNESLKMTKGKIAAQAGHATLGCALMMKDVNPRMYKHWERHGSVQSRNPSSLILGPESPYMSEVSRATLILSRQPKIAVKCKDTEELEMLAAQARSLNLCARTIQDA